MLGAILMKKAIIRRRRREKGQAFVEYVILIAVVALAALVVLANFSDRLREIVTGVTASLGDKSDQPTSSLQEVKDLKHTGIE